jgi:hypothetical protein
VPNLIERYARNMGSSKSPAGTRQRRRIDVEDDYEFHDFIKSITATKEELAAIASGAGYSIAEVRRYLQAKQSEKDHASVLSGSANAP